MEKIKSWNRNLSLQKSMMLYVLIFAGIAFALTMMTGLLCSRKAEKIRSAYPVMGEKYYLTSETGERLGEGTYIGKAVEPLSERDARLISLLEFIPLAAVPVYSALCIIGAALLFYRSKLKRPLEILVEASNKISENNLDFSVDYSSKDEMGQLCVSFELMRSTLARNFSEMWRQVEERKKMNAAFAHELRTPLTVIKGYNEIFQTSGNGETKDRALTMEKHISRLEGCIDGMSCLRRLEDAQPEYEWVCLTEFIDVLNESGEILCSREKKRLYLKKETVSEKLWLDRGCILQVFNNLISNAIRYGDSGVWVSFEEGDQGLGMIVEDDGPGFTQNSLSNAVNPYFTETEKSSGHFGLGLYICRILCEHHGGYLKIENSGHGAAAMAFFKTPDM